MKSKKGIPAELLSLLCCPVCRRKLRYEQAVITGTELWEADISCECGYHAEIRDGVFLSQEQREEKQIVPIDMNRETYSRLKPEGVSRLQKNFYWILKQLKSQKLGGKIVFENFVNTICFSSTGLPYLDREAFYVIADSDERVIRDIKQRIEGLGCAHKILFLVQNSMNYPLKEGAIDIVIDYFHSEIVQSFGFPTLEMEMRPYVRCGTEIVGIYTYAKEGKKTLARTREMFPDSWEGRFILKEFQKNFEQCGVKIEEEKYGGTLTDSVIESYEKGDIFGEWCFRAKYQ